jgi:hypothetical protein
MISKTNFANESENPISFTKIYPAGKGLAASAFRCNLNCLEYNLKLSRRTDTCSLGATNYL